MTSPPQRDLHNSVAPYPGRGSPGGIFTLRPDTAKEDLTLAQGQELLEEEGVTPRPPTPSDKAIIEATCFAPSDLHAYEYASAQGGMIMSCYPKSGDHSKELAIALVKQDLPATSDDPPEVPPAKKSKQDDDANDGAPSM